MHRNKRPFPTRTILWKRFYENHIHRQTNARQEPSISQVKSISQSQMKTSIPATIYAFEETRFLRFLLTLMELTRTFTIDHVPTMNYSKSNNKNIIHPYNISDEFALDNQDFQPSDKKRKRNNSLSKIFEFFAKLGDCIFSSSKIKNLDF
jgi:hypothetical protein